MYRGSTVLHATRCCRTNKHSLYEVARVHCSAAFCATPPHVLYRALHGFLQAEGNKLGRQCMLLLQKAGAGTAAQLQPQAHL
jgi:hypothetical protein